MHEIRTPHPGLTSPLSDLKRSAAAVSCSTNYKITDQSKIGAWPKTTPVPIKHRDRNTAAKMVPNVD